jgi:hypothetical protein
MFGACWAYEQIGILSLVFQELKFLSYFIVYFFFPFLFDDNLLLKPLWHSLQQTKFDPFLLKRIVEIHMIKILWWNCR